jgi:hypothetical protein
MSKLQKSNDHGRRNAVWVTGAVGLVLAGLFVSWQYHGTQPIGAAEFGTLSGDRRLLGAERIKMAAITVALKLDSTKADLIEWTGETLIRRDGVSGKVIWDASRPEKPRQPSHDPFALIKRLALYGDDERPGRLVQPAPDLNGDGTGDIVWVIDGATVILAISGNDGSLLWAFTDKLRGPALPGPVGGGYIFPTDPLQQLGWIFAVPVAADVDGDRVADVVAAFTTIDFGPAAVSGDVRGRHAVSVLRRTRSALVVIAISGRSGKWLWSYARTGRHSMLPEDSIGGLSILNGPGGSTVAVTDQDTWIGLDPATGEPRGQPIIFNSMPIRPVQYADMDGDGEPEIIMVGDAHLRDLELAVYSSKTRRWLWGETVPRATFLQDPALPRGWPRIADLDADGHPEIVVPQIDRLSPSTFYRSVRVYDGATGQPRPDVPLAPVTKHWDGLFYLSESPDLDSDRTKDIVAVSVFEGRQANRGDASDERWIFADAISGRDGRVFWTWRSKIGALTVLSPPLWWGRGRDGWPWLGIVLGGSSSPALDSRPNQIRPPVVCLLEASTGREAHRITELSRPATADLDGDQIDDLWGAVNGELRAVAGERADVRGATVHVSRMKDDPRWARPFPWLSGEFILHPSSFILHGFPLPWSSSGRTTAEAYSGLIWLTLIAIVIPLNIFRVARRRRFRSVRILAVLPLAIALPLTAYSYTAALLPPTSGTPRAWHHVLQFAAASTGGLPILGYFYVVGLLLVRRRFRLLAAWFVLTAIFGLVTALWWIHLDREMVASIEHYSWSGWYQPVVPGAYYLGVIVVIAWAGRSLFRPFKRFLTRPRNGDGRMTIHASHALRLLLLAGTLAGEFADRAEAQSIATPVAENRLLGSQRIPFSPFTAAVALKGKKADFIEWTGKTLIRRDGVSGKVIWDASRPSKPWEPNRDPVAWLRRIAWRGNARRFGNLVQPAPDLNGDGTGDLVWIVESAAAVLALSSQDGSLLWTHSVKLNGVGGSDSAAAAQPSQNNGPRLIGRLFADPFTIDVDGDGIADVIVPLKLREFDPAAEPDGPGSRQGMRLGDAVPVVPLVVAVSGRNGKWLWDCALSYTGRMSFEIDGWAAWVALVRSQSRSVIAVNHFGTWIMLDRADGRPISPTNELRYILYPPQRHTDLNGDGELDLLAVHQKGASALLVAVSSINRGELWNLALESSDHLYDQSRLRDLPLVADLEDDGLPEILFDDLARVHPGGFYHRLRLLNGATGRDRWVRPLAPVTQHGEGVHDLIEGPDLDGDGMRDVLAISVLGGPVPNAPYLEASAGIYVDAISSRDGRSFWSWRTERTDARLVSPAHWWGRGRDGWPLLALSFPGTSTRESPDGSEPGQSLFVSLLEASTGREIHRIEGLELPATADLDGDGADDLWGRLAGELRAFRGERALGRGATVLASAGVIDPRLTRSLPWRGTESVVHPSSFIPSSFPLPWSGPEKTAALAYLGLVDLSLRVFVLPAAIFSLAWRHRFRRLQTVMALPLAIGLPVSACVSLFDDGFFGSTTWSLTSGLLIAATGGLPILAYLFVSASILIRRRVDQLALWVVLSVLCSLMAGLMWLRIDMQTMPSIEHYSWSGWYRALAPGVYYLGLIAAIVWAIRELVRYVERDHARPVVMTLLEDDPSLRED